MDATASTVGCNNDGNPGPNQLTATVAAGTAITAYWNQVWPHPYGPMVCTGHFPSCERGLMGAQTTYLGKCPGSSCDGVNTNSLKWVGYILNHIKEVSCLIILTVQD